MTRRASSLGRNLWPGDEHCGFACFHCPHRCSSSNVGGDEEEAGIDNEVETEFFFGFCPSGVRDAFDADFRFTELNSPRLSSSGEVTWSAFTLAVKNGLV